MVGRTNTYMGEGVKDSNRAVGVLPWRSASTLRIYENHSLEATSPAGPRFRTKA